MATPYMEVVRLVIAAEIFTPLSRIAATTVVEK
jgi:hypothetical protein